MQLAACGVFATALPSSAATYDWYSSQQTSAPAVYQTNLWYAGTAFTAPAGTPATGVVTTVSWK